MKNFYLVWKNQYGCIISDTTIFQDDSGKVQQKPKLTREQWIVFLKQQTMQVALLLSALEEAYKKIDILEGAIQGSLFFIIKGETSLEKTQLLADFIKN